MINDNIANDFDSAEEIISDITDLEEGELAPSVDLTQFVGQKVPIERVYRKFIKSKFGKDKDGRPITLSEGQEIMAPVLVVETIPITSFINSKTQEEIQVRASEMFSLKEIVNDKGEKKFVWSSDERGALTKFLKKMKKTHPEQLLSKNPNQPKSIVQIITRPSKSGQDYLGFIKE